MDTTTPISRATWNLAAVIVFGAFMSGLDASVVNVGLDTLARQLHTDLATVQWASTGYLVALGVSLPVCGWLGRRVGVGRLWLAALAGFTLTSAVCALAPTVEWLIALRVLQGLSAGLLIPAGQTILGQAVGPARLGRVMSTLGIAVTAAPALGPVVGGLVLDVAPWPWLFLLNVPIGVAGLALGWRLIPRGTPEDVGRLDRTGVLLLSVGLPLIVYGVTAWGEQQSLTRTGVAAPILAGALALAGYVAHALAGYVAHARRTTRPVLDLTLFANARFAAATTTAVFTGASLFGAGLLFPLYFQLGRGAGTLETGLLLVSLGIGTILVLPTSGRLVDRYGGGPVSVAGGLAGVATTVPFLLLPVDADPALVQVLLLLRGAATALAVVPATTAAFTAVTRAQLPDATTQVTIAQRLGGALGGSLIAVALASRLDTGTDGALRAGFACLLAATVLGLLAATWLATTERTTTERTTTPRRTP